MSVPPTASKQQLYDAFTALPVLQQQSYFEQCGDALTAKRRAKIQALITKERSGSATTTTS